MTELRRDPFRGEGWIDRLVLPFVREPTLWPIGLVLLGHAIAFLAPLLVLAVRDRAWLAALGVLVTATLSVLALRREQRLTGGFGAWAAVTGATWALSIAGAVVAARWGLV
ncbi:MAG: hypothetical protein AAF430_15005 [Myxococcota bacterium]